MFESIAEGGAGAGCGAGAGGAMTATGQREAVLFHDAAELLESVSVDPGVDC